VKIIHLCNSDILGGAARAAYSLNKALNNSGINSSMLVQKKYGNDESVFPFVDSNLKKIKYAERFFWDYIYIYYLTVKERGRFSFPYWGVDISKHPLIKQADIIHLHWINQGFFSFKTFQSLAKLNKPIVWTFHDMWAFTGGCHYSLGCEKFISNCYECPSLKFANKKDSSNKIFSEKKDLFKNLKFKIVTCSNWLAGIVKKSFLLKDFPVTTIPNTLDINLFKPIEKNVARSKFSLPEDKLLILFGTMTVKDKRKGFVLLKDSLIKLYNDNVSLRKKIEIIIFGSAGLEQASDIPFKTNFLGRIKNDEDIALSYNCADIFVAPSIEDNLPNTVMESLACGIPVAAFNIGGMPDMIGHKKNGYLANPLSVDDLSIGMNWLLQEKLAGNNFQSSSRDKVLINFTPEIVSKQYADIYESILNS
jgi:glycosyltransferase involved in cell wall biosynthesis